MIFEETYIHILHRVGGFEFFYFHPQNWGRWDPIWRAYFSDGLVQPPTSHNVSNLCDMKPAFFPSLAMFCLCILQAIFRNLRCIPEEHVPCLRFGASRKHTCCAVNTNNAGPDTSFRPQKVAVWKEKFLFAAYPGCWYNLTWPEILPTKSPQTNHVVVNKISLKGWCFKGDNWSTQCKTFWICWKCYLFTFCHGMNITIEVPFGESVAAIFHHQKPM